MECVTCNIPFPSTRMRLGEKVILSPSWLLTFLNCDSQALIVFVWGGISDAELSKHHMVVQKSERTQEFRRVGGRTQTRGRWEMEGWKQGEGGGGPWEEHRSAQPHSGV